MNRTDIRSLDREAARDLAKQAATRYYGGLEPLLADEMFDELIEHIKTNWPDEPLPYSVGFGYEVNGNKRPHRVPTGSLPKVKQGTDIKAPANARVTPKYDGISVVLYYDERTGQLCEALSRGGDSGEGKPILHNLLPAALRRSLQRMETNIVAISAEVIIPLDAFQDGLFALYELPRSAAAGITLTQRAHPQRDVLDLMPFRVHFRDGRTLAITDAATETAFKSYVPFVHSHEFADAPVLKDWVNHLGVPTDGMVLWDETALKFVTESVVTTVIAIERNVTRLGRIVPVLRLEARRLYGTTVNRVTVVNEGWVKAYGLGPGAVVRVTKANEIIPQFLETIKPVAYCAPTECPACGGPVTLEGDNLLCSNGCVADLSRIRRFINTYAYLPGHGASSLGRVLKANDVKTFTDLLDKLGEFQSSGLTDRDKKYVDFLNSSFGEALPLKYLLESLNLRGIGYGWSAKLAPFLGRWLWCGSDPPIPLSEAVRREILSHRELILAVYGKRKLKWK